MKKSILLAAFLFLSVSVINAQYITKPITYVLPCGTVERQERIIDIISDPNYLTNRWDELNEELCGDDSNTPVKSEDEVDDDTTKPAI